MPEEKKEKSRPFECPHCHKPIKVKVSTEILEVSSLTEEEGNIDWTYGLTQEQKEVVQIAKDTGVLSAFELTVREVKTHQFPRNIERFFLNFFKTAVPKVIPKFALDYFIHEFAGARIEFWTAQGIGAVVADGVIHTFIPAELVTGRKARITAGRGRARLCAPADEGDLREWMARRRGRLTSLHTEAASLKFLKKQSMGGVLKPSP